MQVLINNKDQFESHFPPESAEYHQLLANLLNGRFEVYGDTLDAHYDDEGSAQFEILAKGPKLIVIEFFGTAK